jgi:cell division septation protein DedD
VQVASTRDLASARLLVDRLRQKGYEASIDTAHGADGRPQYKVRIGSYPDRAPAEKLAERVRAEEKVGAWIVKVQG